jgi:hypothetical protein
MSTGEAPLDRPDRQPHPGNVRPAEVPIYLPATRETAGPSGPQGLGKIDL